MDKTIVFMDKQRLSNWAEFVNQNIDGTLGLDFLGVQYNICLEVGNEVCIAHYQYECSDGTILLKACRITVDDGTVSLLDCL